ncbi:MAG TPA: hypothetical protein VGM87_19275 [Roseomonas sp.]
MIFSFLGRLFGRRSGPAPLLTIQVTLGLGGGELRVLDAGGNLVAGPWTARGSAPEGEYVAADFVRPDQYPGGAAAIGHCGALRLRGEEDRMVLLHGDGGGFPADGAIQVGDEAMAAILNLIPAHPSQLERPVAIRIAGSRDSGLDSDWEWRERWRRDEERWQRERQRERERDSASGNPSGIPAANAEARQDGFDNARAWGMAVGAGAAVAAQDAAAAAGLAKADVTMLPDGDAKPPAADVAAPASAGSAPKAPEAAAASDGWSASGGGYDR